MRISVLAVGGKMPEWVEAGVNEYRKRLPPDIDFRVREIPLARRGKNSDIARARQQEGEALLKAVPGGDRLIALDVKGRALSTQALAETLADWRMQGQNVSLLVGGPDGLDAQCMQRSHARWSLSALTLPHPLVRVLLVEQLYRAWSILQGHPYHR